MSIMSCRRRDICHHTMCTWYSAVLQRECIFDTHLSKLPETTGPMATDGSPGGSCNPAVPDNQWFTREVSSFSLLWIGKLFKSFKK